MMRRIYCGSDNCTETHHVIDDDSGLRYHYQPLHEHLDPGSPDPWQLPLPDDLLHPSRMTGHTTGISSGPEIHFNFEEKVADNDGHDDTIVRRLALMSEVMRLMSEHDIKGDASMALAIADWADHGR